MVTEVDKYVIQKVKERRVKQGLSQSQLAFEIGLASKGFIGMLESGKYGKKYSVSQLNEIAKVLECSPRDFLPKEAI